MTRLARGNSGKPAAIAPDGVEAAFGSLSCARDILQELGVADREPLLYLIRGRSETGKSTLLTTIRRRLAARGIATVDDPAAHDADGNGQRCALIVDDAHQLPIHRLELLRVAAERRRCPVFVAAEPRPHHRGLRDLTDAVARHGRVVELRALGSADMAPFARELGMLVPPPVAGYIHRQTGGIRGGVIAGLRAACAARLDGATPAAVDKAVHVWARSQLSGLSPVLLDTFVIAATGAGLDADELAAIFHISPEAAHDVIDQARASALVTDADLLLAAAVAPLRALLGEQRFIAVQRRLLTARLDANLLGAHTALLMAESGVRDPRLAQFLCAAAERAGSDAARYYAAAVASGADPDAIAERWAQATARSGVVTVERPEPVPAPGEQMLPRTGRAPDPTARLSDREREVAELVLLGLTYREIGARLYISAKTVEHHVARIRRRIGARSRSELLSMLRAMGHGSLLV
ncbi:hypothetical protein B0T44_11960 [Nocardia donostiensis]|uniref:HTH luxR-type domain-containing protein n=1 Tax=Nocardia donostiensis TaxID=1538463 RepID=A0A1W0ATH8_9NOCA|nr:helix-turn-helix transcriptional regulator [Nocardia donostiensis]ONM49475.1 hypothetical protein B0T46_06285 [Nocardia donostiensis]OQS13546.1 hypothetical protein B0T36_19290 [Nocardia donostiensis]OQS19952.1 hypothetical protein B0T44_11960 [Nocardia donostiensis]